MISLGHPLANAAFLLGGLVAIGALSVTVLGNWVRIKAAIRGVEPEGR